MDDCILYPPRFESEPSRDIIFYPSGPKLPCLITVAYANDNRLFFYWR